MAANKAKRSTHLAQPDRRSLRSEPSELRPVKLHAYRTIAEINVGFEKVLQDLKTLEHISFFKSAQVSAAFDHVSRIRAEVNRDFALALHEREAANAAYFDRLCRVPERISTVTRT